MTDSSDTELIKSWEEDPPDMFPEYVEGYARLIALARIGAAVQPRPISEAPRDGALIDIFLSFISHDGAINSNADGRFPDCYWNAEAAAWEGDDLRHYESFDVSELEPGQSGLIVTHWMPRPQVKP